MALPAFTAMNILLSFSLLLLHFSASSSTSFPTEARPSKSGYLVVNPSTGSSIFYTFYEAQESVSSISTTPLLIWLQGGPGCSSMIGNFYELGPWRVNQNVMLEPNEGAWNRVFGLLFLDNPVGTGFSIASCVEDIPKDQNAIAEHLFVAIKSFIVLDPLYKSRPVYITGESYAGKYVPALGHYIIRENLKMSKGERVNLAGVAIGNGLTDPVTQVMTHADSAYSVGLINGSQRTRLERHQTEVVRLVAEKKWGEATDARNDMLDMLRNMTGLATLLDTRRKSPYDLGAVRLFLSKVEVKKVLGVKPTMVWEECSDVVWNAMRKDVMKSVKFMVEELVEEKNKVLLYQGEHDLIDDAVSVDAWVKDLKWEGIEEFRNSERKVWRGENGKVAGYVKKWGSLSNVVVSGAGHFVPTDQAVNSQTMIEDWVMGQGVFG